MDADIVFIGNDLERGEAPRVNLTYNLALANSTGSETVLGVQLQRKDRQCGWVRRYDAQTITTLLQTGNRCSGVVLSRRRFIWNGETCFWGVIRWVTDGPAVYAGPGDEFTKGLGFHHDGDETE